MQMMPNASEYQTALQNLSRTILVPGLQEYQAIRGRRGQFIVYSGGFVMTCPVQHPVTGDRWALRFFYRMPNDIEDRYRAITAFVGNHRQTGLFADIRYEREGVMVAGYRYPICVMEWLDGLTLRRYVARNLGNPGALQPLADKFRTVVQKLRQVGAAHGDLSHENIMVVNEELRLVDYDGMYVPQMAGKHPCVAGQQNFQHPQRIQEPGYFGPYQDNFGSIAIYISLLSLRYDPTLFERYENGGNSLLFRKQDFVDPYNSPYMYELSQIPDLAPMVEGFREVCQGDLWTVPSLDDFLRGRVQVAPQVAQATGPLPTGVLFGEDNNPIFSAISPNKSLLMESVGHVGTLAGRVNRVVTETDSIVLEFTSGNQLTSAIMIVGDAYEAIMKSGADPVERFQGRWLKATGPIHLLEWQGEHQPIVELNVATDLEISERSDILALISGQQVSTAPAPGEKKIWTRPAPDSTKKKSKFDPGGGAFGQL